MGGPNEDRKGPAPGRQETVKARFARLNWVLPVPGRRNPAGRKRVGDGMSVLVYIVLTVAIFALLGLIQKLVEGL